MSAVADGTLTADKIVSGVMLLLSDSLSCVLNSVL